MSLIAAVYVHVKDTRHNARVLSERCISRIGSAATLTSSRSSCTSLDDNLSDASANDGLRRIAWHPIDRRCLTDYKILMRLGISGIGQLAAVWWCWELVGRECFEYAINLYSMFLFQSLPACECTIYRPTSSLIQRSLGAVSLAAQSVLLISSSAIYQIPMSLSIAAAVR